VSLACALPERAKLDVVGEARRLAQLAAVLSALRLQRRYASSLRGWDAARPAVRIHGLPMLMFTNAQEGSQCPSTLICCLMEASTLTDKARVTGAYGDGVRRAEGLAHVSMLMLALDWHSGHVN
jgi:hypothetical protein